MSTCNRLDLRTLRSQPAMPKNLPNHFFLCSPNHVLISDRERVFVCSVVLGDGFASSLVTGTKGARKQTHTHTHISLLAALSYDTEIGTWPTITPCVQQ